MTYKCKQCGQSYEDKFLAEAMGECWHKETISREPYPFDVEECVTCGAIGTELKRMQFSTWEGFGKLWEWAQRQPWWEEFYWQNSAEWRCKIVHPDRFAEAIYEFLKGI